MVIGTLLPVNQLTTAGKIGVDNFVKLVYKDTSTVNISVFSGTFLGNNTRNFYGDKAPSKLDIKWKHYLGKGRTYVKSAFDTIPWFGAGWTGQPLLVIENDVPFIIQGAYDHKLKKINAYTGELVWEYAFDDIIKGTGTIWINENSVNDEEKYVILQGSRLGNNNNLASIIVPSFRAVSYITGKELWRMNVVRTESYSRDVDGSALVIGDTAYIGLENGLFTVFNPDPRKAAILDGIIQPEIYFQLPLYNSNDILKHGGNLVTESSPCQIGNHIYITAGSGHVYGYNIITKEIDWDFYIGADLDGSPVVTYDNCLLVTIEKQYINGKGGVLKLNPSLEPENAVVWYFPTGDVSFSSWNGGIIGSPAVNDLYRKHDDDALAAFAAIDGKLYVVKHDEIDSNNIVKGFDGVSDFYAPKLVFSYKTGTSISTPVFTENRLVAAGYNGIYLFGYNINNDFILLDKKNMGFEATPLCYKGMIFIASRNGYLYCFRDKPSLSRLPACLPESFYSTKLPSIR